MEKVFLKIMRQLNYPPIFLIPPKQFEMIEGEEKKEDNAVGDQVFGIAAIDYPVIAVRDDIGGKTLLNVLWHEVAHHLWPWRQHWWIEAFGEKMAGGGGKGMYCEKYGHLLKIYKLSLAWISLVKADVQSYDPLVLELHPIPSCYSRQRTLVLRWLS